MIEPPKTDMEKLKFALAEIGVQFEMTDDSEESALHERLDTVIQIDAGGGHFAYFFFRRDGTYKEFDCF